MVPVSYYLALAVIMFFIGIVGVLVRRNALIVFMSLELMFNAANLVLVTFARQFGAMNGQITVFFVMTVAAAEVAIGLALMVVIFRTKHSIDMGR